MQFRLKPNSMAANLRMWQSLSFLFALFVIISAKQKVKPIKLSEDNWDDMLQGEWLVKFYAPWCPACKALTTVWEDVASWSEDLDINVGMVDVTENPGLSGRFMVMALPTIFHVKDGIFRVYRGSRDENEIVSYVDDKKWLSVEPLPWYKSPNSIHMGGLSLFFKLSMHIRNVHTSMTEVYGIPVWGSYTIFAIATIIVGLFLGVLIVFLCDVIYPPQHQPQPQHMPPRYDAPWPKNNLEDQKDTEGDVVEDDRVVNDKKEDKETKSENSGTRKRNPKSNTN